MYYINKYFASLIGVLLFVLPLIFQFFITDIFGYTFFGTTVWSFMGVGSIISLFNNDLSMKSLIEISSIVLLLISVFTTYLYLKIVEKHTLNNKFSVVGLMLFFIIQHFLIHQIYYGVLVLFSSNKLDANDFIGVISTGFYSSFLFIIFGIIIDFTKNRNGIPSLKI